MRKYCGNCGASYFVDGYYSQCGKCGSMCPEDLEEVIRTLFKELAELREWVHKDG